MKNFRQIYFIGGRKKDSEEAGKTMADMYLLAPESKILLFIFYIEF